MRVGIERVRHGHEVVVVQGHVDLRIRNPVADGPVRHEREGRFGIGQVAGGRAHSRIRLRRGILGLILHGIGTSSAPGGVQDRMNHLEIRAVGFRQLGQVVAGDGHEVTRRDLVGQRDVTKLVRSSIEVGES